MRLFVIMALLSLLAAPAIAGTPNFQRLAKDRFIVAAANPMGNPNMKATKKAYAYAASICQAAGYRFLEILDSSAPTIWAAAKVEFRVHHENSDGRLDCTENADAKIVERARRKLARGAQEKLEKRK